MEGPFQLITGLSLSNCATEAAAANGSEEGLTRLMTVIPAMARDVKYSCLPLTSR